MEISLDPVVLHKNVSLSVFWCLFGFKKLFKVVVALQLPKVQGSGGAPRDGENVSPGRILTTTYIGG